MTDESKCGSCGQPFSEHTGVVGLCAELTKAKATIKILEGRLECERFAFYDGLEAADYPLDPEVWGRLWDERNAISDEITNDEENEAKALSLKIPEEDDPIYQQMKKDSKDYTDE